MRNSPQTNKMYDSSIQKSSKHNSTAKKMVGKKRGEGEFEEDEYIGLAMGLTETNVDVMGKKKRINNEREKNAYYDEISESDVDKHYSFKGFSKKKIQNYSSKNLKKQFHNTLSPT